MPRRGNSSPSAISPSDGWNVANDGILRDHAATMKRFASTMSIPEDLLDTYFGLAYTFVDQVVPRKSIVTAGLTISCCFTVLRNFTKSCPISSERLLPYVLRFVRIWPRAFAWARYLRQEMDRFSVHDTNDRDRQIAIEHARGIANLMAAYAFSKQTAACFCDNSVLSFIAEFWATDSDVQEILDEKAEALNACASCLDRRELDGIFDRIQELIGTAEKVAVRAIGNARLSMQNICPGDAPGIRHYEMLFTMIMRQPNHAISKAILDAGVVPFLSESLSSTIYETNLADISAHHCHWICICAGTQLDIYRTSEDRMSLMRQGFESGQVGVLFMMGILFDYLIQYYQKPLTDAFSETILPRMHLADLLLPTLGGMRRFSENRRHGNFPVSFVPIWAEFETCLLEHAILRHTHALGNANVYCDNVLCHTKMSLRALRRCAGCHLAMYCSRRCQRSAWISGHRTECKEITRHDHAHAAISINDKSYLLHWVITQLSPLVPALRHTAHGQFPLIPFEKIGLYIDLRRRPATVLMHPLELGLYADEKRHRPTPHITHFMDLAMKRVGQGNINATLLTIRCNDKRGVSLHYVIVDLDKNPLEAPQRNANSGRLCCQDRDGNLIVGMMDEIDLVIEELKRAAILEEKNIWSPGFLWTHVRAALNLA